MLFAVEVDLTTVAVIVSAIFLGLQQLYRMKIDSDREKAKIARDTYIAQQQEEIKTATVAVIDTIKTVAVDIHKVELATNSMKDALVDASGKAGEKKGADDERARSDAKNK